MFPWILWTIRRLAALPMTTPHPPAAGFEQAGNQRIDRLGPGIAAGLVRSARAVGGVAIPTTRQARQHGRYSEITSFKPPRLPELQTTLSGASVGTSAVADRGEARSICQMIDAACRRPDRSMRLWDLEKAA